MESSSCFALSHPPFIFFFFLFVFLSVNNIAPLEVEAAPNYLTQACLSPNSLFTTNSTYENNLKTVLSNLSSSTSASVADSGFSTTTSGIVPDKVYGLFLCRGDVSNAVCRDCVATATQEILRGIGCPNQRVSTIWYDECMLRYSNQSIFSVMEPAPEAIVYSKPNNSLPPQSLLSLAAAMNISIDQASIGGSKKFGTAVSSSSLQTLYVLTQCTPDLSSSDCRMCLSKSFVGSLANYSDKYGVRVLTPSCPARFESYPFSTAFGVETPPTGKGNNSTMIIIAIVLPGTLAVVLFFLAWYLIRKRARKAYLALQRESGIAELSAVEFLQFNLETIHAATCNFSSNNKLGQGGFGEVFQGKLTNGQEIAVKRLSQNSRQGVEEFKNEAVLVAKLQHRNLVRLLGFCLEGQEKLLIYEFVPNGSLDYFLFDHEKCKELIWSRRYKIIVGVTRGMLYLHEDSRLRIIHRDLKASNILLDNDMNPKISDFATARIFGVEQSQANTRKIVGTFGYMPPEYVMQGQFSVKSDVYSLGILLLEIISGKMNGSFYEEDEGGSLANYAWKHWKQGTPLEVLDRSIGELYSRNEVVRCLHIALLCIQEDRADRPTMASIVLMLNNYHITPPMPKEPAFFLQRRIEQEDEPNCIFIPLSVNEVSITEVCPR